MSNKIKKFFREWDKIWEEIPNYLKIFIYSTTSVLLGDYISGQEITLRTVMIIVAVNIGLYQIPTEGRNQIKKIL